MGPMKAKELAKKLGVSPATISLVLNNKPGISDSLRHKLLEQIREMGCEGMVAGSRPEGVPATDPARPVIVYLIYTSCDDADTSSFFSPVMEGAEMEARNNHFSMMVFHMSQEGGARPQELVGRSGNVAGVIVQASGMEERALRDVKALNVPYVFVDSYRPGLRVSGVCVNNEQGVYSLIQYLKEQGHREIGYVRSRSRGESLAERARCFRQAMWMLGLEDRQEYQFTVEGKTDSTVVTRLAKQFSQAERLPTALVAESDMRAVQTIQALRRLKLRVPEDVSVTGFDDRSLCTMIEPNLTSVKNSRHLMGRECVIMLQNLRRLKKLGVTDPWLKYELPAELVVRESVGPPPERGKTE